MCEAVGDGARESEQQDVTVGGLGEDVAAQFRDALTKLLCLCVGLGGVLPPEIVLEVGDELGAEVTHLRAELSALFAVVLEVGHECLVQHHNRFAHQHPVFGAPETDDIDAAVGGHLLETLAESHCRVGNAGTIKMQIHAERVDEVGDGADLLAGVGRAEFRALGDIDGFGLRMVLEAPVGEVRADELWRQLAIGRGNGHQRCTCHEGGRTALINSDVGSFSAEDAVERPHAGALRDHVGTGAVEDGEHLSRFSELCFEKFPQSGGVSVVAIRDLMVGIARGNRL